MTSYDTTVNQHRTGATGRRRRSSLGRLAAAAGGLVALTSFGLAAPASADAVYHTYHGSLTPVGDQPGRASVVNIHPNGPKVFAMERYQIAHAVPKTTYRVVIYLHPFSPDCTGPAADFGYLGGILSAEIETNAAGNGHAASPKFAPGDVAGLNDAEHGVEWVIYDADENPAFESDCSVDTFD